MIANVRQVHSTIVPNIRLLCSRNPTLRNYMSGSLGTLRVTFQIKVAPFVRVDKDILWVTPEIWERIQVISNTNWLIL